MAHAATWNMVRTLHTAQRLTVTHGWILGRCLPSRDRTHGVERSPVLKHHWVLLGVLLARPPGGRETAGRQWGDRKTGRLTGNRKIRDGDALHHVEGRLLKAHDTAKVGLIDVRAVEDGIGDFRAAEGRAG